MKMFIEDTVRFLDTEAERMPDTRSRTAAPCLTLLERFLRSPETLKAGHSYGFDLNVEGVQNHVDLATLRSLGYLRYSCGVSQIYGVVNRLDRMMLVVKALVGEAYIVYGLDHLHRQRHEAQSAPTTTREERDGLMRRQWHNDSRRSCMSSDTRGSATGREGGCGWRGLGRGGDRDQWKGPRSSRVGQSLALSPSPPSTTPPSTHDGPPFPQALPPLPHRLCRPRQRVRHFPIPTLPASRLTPSPSLLPYSKSVDNLIRTIDKRTPSPNPAPLSHPNLHARQNPAIDKSEVNMQPETKAMSGEGGTIQAFAGKERMKREVWEEVDPVVRKRGGLDVNLVGHDRPTRGLPGGELSSSQSASGA